MALRVNTIWNKVKWLGEQGMMLRRRTAQRMNVVISRYCGRATEIHIRKTVRREKRSYVLYYIGTDEATEP